MKEFNLSKKRKQLPAVGGIYLEDDVKEFIKRLLTHNNISKGFVEVSTIKYYAGEKLI